MTGVIEAVDVRVTGFATLVATGDNLPGDAFTEAFVKDEILALVSNG